jgi:hypothetical protein
MDLDGLPRGVGVNALDEIYLDRTEVPTPLTGKLVMIEGDENYEDILGIHLGCFRSTRWDWEGKYIFHSILSREGTVQEYCLNVGERVEGIIKVIG